MQTNQPTLLLVDDETDVLELTATYLRTLGFSTLTAPDALSAISLFANHPEIDLLITDIVMPGDLNGVELGERFLHHYPHSQVIYTSGYPAGSLTWNKNMLSQSNMLVKPYRFTELHMLIQRLLARRKTLALHPSPPANPALTPGIPFHSR